MTKIITKETLVPIGLAITMALFAGTILVHFTSVKLLAEANKNQILRTEKRVQKAIDHTDASRDKVFDRLSRLEVLIGRLEGKLDMVIKEKK